MIRKNSSYFQITNNILVEYVHYDLSSTQDGSSTLGFEYPNFTGYIYDISSDALGVVTDYKTNEIYLFNNSFEQDIITNNHKGNIVFPINKSQSEYIDPRYVGDIPYSDLHGANISPISPVDCSSWGDREANIYYDEVIIHFTSSLYMGEYEAFIFNAYIRDAKNTKVNLSSILMDANTDLYLESTPLLIGSKLYTKNYKFRIPSVDWMINSGYGSPFHTVLFSDTPVSEHCPITFAIVGVTKSWYESNEPYKHYQTEQLQPITIPYKDENETLSIKVEKAIDGDYFILQAVADDGQIEFSDYLSQLGGNYTVMHDVSLVEYYIDDLDENKVKSKVTHREYFVSATEKDAEIVTNVDMFNSPICYRPVLQTKNTFYFVIQDVLRIYNNGDNTTIVKSGMLRYGDKEDESVGIYGKYIQPLVSSTSQILKVNVYNKRTDVDNDNITIKNTSVGSIAANVHNHEITSFIDAKSIAISVQNVTVEDKDNR